ncbi:MAG TPA: hypothetical protein VGB98_14070 [Pyrinomonadaceae bacterium]|jgi:hypothetical protein
MYLFLLKKALPFTLTFAVGTALGGLTWLFGGSGKKAETVVVTRTYEFGSRCRVRRHKLVAESKPLLILFKPDARYPLAPEGRVRVNVTFGADGEVKAVKPLASRLRGRDEDLVRVKAMWDAVEGAARQIRFTPETVDGVPVSVERDVEIRFLAD